VQERRKRSVHILLCPVKQELTNDHLLQQYYMCQKTDIITVILKDKKHMFTFKDAIKTKTEEPR